MIPLEAFKRVVKMWHVSPLEALSKIRHVIPLGASSGMTGKSGGGLVRMGQGCLLEVLSRMRHVSPLEALSSESWMYACVKIVRYGMT